MGSHVEEPPPGERMGGPAGRRSLRRTAFAVFAVVAVLVGALYAAGGFARCAGDTDGCTSSARDSTVAPLCLAVTAGVVVLGAVLARGDRRLRWWLPVLLVAQYLLCIGLEELIPPTPD